MDKFTIEKNAKNRAYAFIIALGLFQQFAEFCEETKNLDAHELCNNALQIFAD